MRASRNDRIASLLYSSFALNESSYLGTFDDTLVSAASAVRTALRTKRYALAPI